MANEYPPRRKVPTAPLPDAPAQEAPVDPMAPRLIKAPQAPTPKMSPYDAGVLQAKTEADFQRGQASVAPAAPKPLMPDTARFGVLKRNGIDPKTGQEYGFVGVGANGQGNVTTDSYEKAREFSQGQRSMPQAVTPAVQATATTPAQPEMRTGVAPTSLPYVAAVAGQQRGFSQDGSRDVIAPPPAPAAPITAAPVQPQYMAPAPANPVVVQEQPPAPVAPSAPTAIKGANINGVAFARPPVVPPPSAPAVDMTPAPAATPVNAPSMASSVATGVASLATGKGPFVAIGANIQAGRAKQKAKETAARAGRPAPVTYLMGGANKRKPAMPAVNDTAPSPLRQVADVGLPPINPIGKNRPRASLAYA